jgi:hypothetical protein
VTGWVRLWRDMPSDPKWRTIARRSGQSIGNVIAVFNFMMVHATDTADERGCLTGFDAEDVATSLDLEEDDVLAIMAAMEGKVLNGNLLSGWDKRQPKREDGTAAQRKAAWKKRNQANSDDVERTGTHGNAVGTQGNAPETETETETETESETEVCSVTNVTGAQNAPIGPNPGQNDADAPETDAAALPLPIPDPEKVMLDGGIRLLTQAGITEGKARSILGKWKRDHETERIIAALGAAQREGAIEPVSFIERVLRNGTASRTSTQTKRGPSPDGFMSALREVADRKPDVSGFEPAGSFSVARLGAC